MAEGAIGNITREYTIVKFVDTGKIAVVIKNNPDDFYVVVQDGKDNPVYEVHNSLIVEVLAWPEDSAHAIASVYRQVKRIKENKK